MARTDGTYRPGVSIHEAAVMLGVSPTTVRRWVASGRLRSQRFDRPQGAVVRVFVGPDQLDGPAAVREQAPSDQVPTDAPPPTAEQAPSGAALAAWAASLLAPIAAELGEARQAILGQAETIRDQAETIGRQGAELEAERAKVTRVTAELARADVTLAGQAASHAHVSRQVRRLRIGLAVAGALAIAAVLAPAWVR